MSLLVIALGVGLMSIPALVVASRLGAAAKVRIACVGLSGGLVVLGAGLTLTASPLLLWWHDGPNAVTTGIAHLSPGGPWAWSAAGLLVGYSGSAVVASARTARNKRRDAAAAQWLAQHQTHHGTGVELRLVQAPTVFAFSVPTPSPHVVVSHAMANSLTPDGLDAVIAHEAAHLRLGHQRHLLALTVYARIWGWLPGVNGVITELRHDIERWADHDAVRTNTTTTASLAAALGTIAALSPPAPARAANDRSRSLLSSRRTTPPLESAGLIGVLTLLLVAALYAVTHAATDLGTMIAAIH